jgi:hypothetical protein
VGGRPVVEQGLDQLPLGVEDGGLPLIDVALAKTSTSIGSMITASSEQLLTIDELRARMPALRARETGLKDQIAALDAQAADRDALPQARRRPRGLPRPAPPKFRHRHHPGQAAYPARRRPGRPRRPREDHHPPPHPRPGTIQQQRRPP